MVRHVAFLALLTLSAMAQSSVELRATLALTDVQIHRLNRVKASAHPARQPPQPGTPIYAYRQTGVINKWQQEEDSARDVALAVLTEEQRHKLTDAAMVLQQLQNGAMQLVSVGAISCSQWPGMCACFYPIRQDEMKLGLSEAQLTRFEQLRVAHLGPMNELQGRIGVTAARLANTPRNDPASADQLRKELAELQKESEDVSASHAIVLDVLDYMQKIKLAAFEADLRLVNEAMDIGLLTRPGKGEVLCN
jgi:hypothetical protein